MGQAQEQPQAQPQANNLRAPKDSPSYIKTTHTDEIIIALCGQMGSYTNSIAESLKTELQNKYHYSCIDIKLSSYINKYSDFDLDTTNEEKRINDGISGGNALREEHGNAILAQFAIRDISIDRHKETDKEQAHHHLFKPRRKCYIINSLKNPDELEVLKLVYGDMLYTVGVFSPIQIRIQNLRREGISELMAHKLINKDTGEDFTHGQKVEKVFIESDYFLRIPNEDIAKIKPKIERFLKLVFDEGIITPDINETAMYEAHAASVNSGCLSRQVGAAITDSEGELLALGWNDVPKFGGGVYTNADVVTSDMRCYNFNGKGCNNSRKKDQMVNKITDSLLEKSLIKSEELIDVKSILEDSGISSLIEFARSIHAEMHALIRGSQKTGNKMIGGKLFCTTYPCHNCARHIILAGIEEIYYIEPYKKSLCTELHSDAITEDEGQADNKVSILMYEGVAPIRYLKFFKMRDNRKAKCITSTQCSQLSPKHTLTLRAISQLEIIIAKDLEPFGLIE